MHDVTKTIFVIMSKSKKARTFQEEIENDVLQTVQMMRREDAEAVSPEEKHAIDIFKRALMIIDKVGVSVSDGRKVVSASANHITVCSYLAHGSRVLLQIPPTGKEGGEYEFMNWFIHGDKEKKFIEYVHREVNALFPRSISSHSTHLEYVDGKSCFVKDKGLAAGALDTIT